MLVSLRAEALKVRRLWLGSIAAAVGAALAGLVWLTLRDALRRQATETNAETPWQNNVIGDTTILVVLVLPTLVIIVTALVFYVEHRNDMWKQLRATPRSMLSVYAAKFAVVQGATLVCVGVLLGTALLAWSLSPDDMRAALGAPDAEVRRTLSFLALELYLSLLPAALVQFALSAWTSNVLHSVGVGLALTIACLLLAGPTSAAWYPYAYPGAVVMSTFAAEPVEGPGGGQEVDVGYRAPAGALGAATAARAVILVDQAHGNRHRLGTVDDPGTLGWIATTAAEAGIEVGSVDDPIRPEALSGATVLVVAGAASALSGAEVGAIVEWVRQGGSLLLLTDHPPFGEPVRPLAEALGVGFTIDVVGDDAARDPRAPDAARIVFTRSGGLVASHEITTGVERVVTYGGQGVWREAEGSVVLLELPKTARAVDGARLGQLLAFELGRGRVVVSGETALFTAQRKGDGSAIGVGDGETDNGRLAVNTLRWLLRR